MAVGKTFTSDSDPTADGLALTFVVPAKVCNLRCSFCVVTQRREAGPVRLDPEHYVYFLKEAAQRLPVRVIGLQGYEPLLPESWPFTQAILEASNSMGIPTSMVTNGTHLCDRVSQLADLQLKDLTVSLDSPDAVIHDKIRGVQGAFRRTMDGIRKAMACDRFRDRVVVASVLLPKRRSHLDHMPRFLADLGIKYFGVTPLIRIGHGRTGGIVADSSSLFEDLDRLWEQCEEVGLVFVVDDELKQFRHLVDGINKFVIHSLERPERLLRLTPSGACSVGVEVLRSIDADSCVWDPRRESPAKVLDRIMDKHHGVWCTLPQERTRCRAA